MDIIERHAIIPYGNIERLDDPYGPKGTSEHRLRIKDPSKCRSREEEEATQRVGAEVPVEELVIFKLLLGIYDPGTKLSNVDAGA